jgi:hypothetical protein
MDEKRRNSESKRSVFMTRYGGLGIVVLTGLLIGCQPKPPAAAPPAPAQSYDEIRTELMSANPGAVVGEVNGTYVEHHLVSIDNVDPGQLQLGDPVSFLDDRLNTLTIGSVTKILQDGNIIVRIEPAAAGAREPEIGDVAVHIAPGSTLVTTPPPATMTQNNPTTMPAAEPETAPAATEPGNMSPALPAPTPAPATEAAPAPAPTTAPATQPGNMSPAVPAPAASPAAPPMTQPELNK